MRMIILMVTALLLSACWDIGTGEKIGAITRLHKEGYFCKTWEVQIIRGGMTNGSGSFGQAFNLTIENDAMADKAKAAMESQQEVKIKYHQEFATLCRSSSSNSNDGDNYFMDDIEVLDAK